MAKNKTTQTYQSVTGFIETISDEIKRDDSFYLVKLMEELTGFEGKMWGSSIIGFGSYHYRYESGHEGDMPLAAFSPRANALVFYLSGSFENRETLLEKLGKHKTSKGCVYIKKLSDVDTEILKEMIIASASHIQTVYPAIIS